MARKKTKKKAAPSFGERVAFATSPGARALGIGLLTLASLGALGWGAIVVHARAGEVLGAEPTEVDIRWPLLPNAEQTWLGEGLRAQIRARVDDALAGRPLDAGAMAAAGAALDATGWFDGPPTIARTGDNTIRVSGDWREPACAIRIDGRDYPIDWLGRPLPLEYPAGQSGLRIVLGVQADVPIDAGGALAVRDPWPGDDVVAGIELLGPLLREPFSAQVAGVDVTAFYTQSRLAIITDTDSRVVWGGRFGEFTPGEATTEAKLTRLRNAVIRPGANNRIDRGAHLFDISGEHLILDRIAP